MQSFEFKIISVRQETHDVKSIILEKQDLVHKPGQYMMVELETGDDDNSRPLSIASSPTEGFLMFSTKISQSAFKQKFNSLKEGDAVKAKGPMGIFTLKEDAKEVIFLGGGIGITPFRDMIKHATDRKLPAKMTLMYSNKTSKDIIYKDEWPVFESENKNLKVVHTITDDAGWHGRKGRISDSMIKEFCDDTASALFYICGPPAMVDGLSQLLKSMDVPQQNIKAEKFAGY